MGQSALPGGGLGAGNDGDSREAALKTATLPISCSSCQGTMKGWGALLGIKE